MKAIGGYFELELSQGKEFHQNAISLNTGRNAFEYILLTKGYQKVYLPYYTCDAMLNPIKKLNLNVDFYHIDEEFNPIFDFSLLSETDVFVYTNYFGICDSQVLKVSSVCKNLIVDNAQAFYSKPLPGVDTFYSPRKFFGVPDGAYLFTDTFLLDDMEKDISIERTKHLIGRVENEPEKFYNNYQLNEEELSILPIQVMSKFTKRMMSSIDYNSIGEKRKNNFLYLHDFLKKHNKLRVDLTNNEIPLVYPLLIEDGLVMKSKLIQNKIFVATYWPNVFEWCNKESLEYKLSNNLVNLPIDQRYSLLDMKYIVETIKKVL